MLDLIFEAMKLATAGNRLTFRSSHFLPRIASSSEESRYTLNGALLVMKPQSVMMVATDGHRLALVERGAPGGQVAGLSNELR